MSKSVFTPRVGSEIFETSVIKTDEAFLFVKAATEAGADLETAYDDMKMIDDILCLKRIHFAIHGEIKRTRSGNLRKGTTLYDAINDIIGARCNKSFNNQ